MIEARRSFGLRAFYNKMDNHRSDTIGDEPVFVETPTETYTEDMYVHLIEPKNVYVHLRNREVDAD